MDVLLVFWHRFCTHGMYSCATVCGLTCRCYQCSLISTTGPFTPNPGIGHA